MSIDIYTGLQEIIISFENPTDYLEIKVYDEFLILLNNNQLILINTLSKEKFIKNYPKQIINSAKFIRNDKLIYLYGNFFQILDTQLNIVYDIQIDNQQLKDFDCTDFKFQIVCLNRFVSGFKEFLVYYRTQNISEIKQIDIAQQIQYIFDEIYENIYIYQNDKNTPNQVKIFSSIGVLKQVIQKKVSLILIDRANLTFNQVLTGEDNIVKIKKFIFVSHLNYLLLQYDDDLSKISIYDISAEKIIYQIQVNQNQQNNNNITYLQFDESQSRYVMLIDSQGTFYLSSIDINQPFQNFVNVCYSCDFTLFEFISYDSLSNDVYIRYSDSIYQLDYSSLGLEREPSLNEPYSLFTQIQINKLQTDYFVLAEDSIVFRYSQNKLKSELSIIKSKVLDIKYNQSNDVFILALEESLFFYQQYQSRINNNLNSVIQSLEMINFQQFIIDSVVITLDQKILHLDILTGSIIKIINFNITQIVTSFNVNDNKDLIIVGFSDGQILQYNLIDQVYFLYDTSQKGPFNISIIKIQLIEISATNQFAYAASNGGLLFQIDTLNKKVISQIDLKVLVTEDPNLSLSQFLIDQTYKRYIFCFNKQKKVYVYNYNNNQQERNLPLHKKYSTLGITQNYLFIKSIYQINFYRLSAKIEFVAFIKKDFIQDSIIDFKLIENNILALFLIDRFELFIANGDKFNMIAQITSQYPRMLSSQLDYEKNTFHIVVLHKSGIFENSYNLNIYKSETISECSFFISSQEQQNLILQSSQITPQQKEIQTINGASLVDQENLFIYLHLQLPSANIQNTFLQISQLKNTQYVLAPYDIQNNFIALSNDTFSNLSQQILQFSNFQFNSAQNGGAIHFSEILTKIEFKESKFQLNNAKSSGGALYFENIKDCLVIFDKLTIVRNNRALIGGGLRIVQDDQSTLTLPQNFPFYENVFDNQAEIYGDDSTSYLQNIIIKNNDKINDELFTFYKYQSSVPINFQNEFSRYAELRQFRSGGLINFKIYIVDEQNRLLSFQKDKLILGLYPKDIAQELNNIQISIFQLSQNESQMFGQNIINYNEYDSQEFAFKINDLKITGNLNKIQFFYINSTIQTNSITKKPILLSIEFRNCKLGEIIQQINTNIYQCNECLEGTYQINDPQTLYRQSIEEKKDINQCINCPQSAISCKGDMIQLKNGFWRQSNQTDEIIACDPIINSCQAENPNSINYCITGYLGPICQQCDILGEIWKGSRYSESLKRGVCGICESQFKQWVFMILKFIILEAYFLYVLGVFIKKFKYTQTCYYLRMLKIMPISSSSIQDYSGFYIKIILNYYQLSALLIPQPKNISINLNLFNEVIGSGGIQVSLGIDCLVSEQNIRSLVSQISYFTKSLTCNQVGTQLYNPIDPSFDCYDTNVIKYLYPFSVMVLIFWSLLPLVFLKLINQNKNKLDQCLIKYKYGYYYGELKPKYYYWEFVRIYLKIVIIYLYTLLNNNNQIVAILTISAKTQLEKREKQQFKQRKTNPKKKVIKEANNKIYKQLSMGMDSSQQVLIRDQIQKELIN
ncbi:transmembrane protein, putative (macronuclear) [Tetrahymena thermophila SB210]|uniref:Transmembrane protein, putative n=1 Tax=Tetrahymena thermophila (strain SB210) TaxID=312017 RepID=W7XE41_TETTS|nr:transmembrane protein, putative [Tetrahymena thermophila SB210]EWS75927.1 transmembrane protein, putative [Tetrahymena thermophila SB210]|eukprot:XP_012651536.1 transmembrane protein, putative [Tetrahymena thermophila SB210]